MALKHVFGETPTIKMLDFLIDHNGFDYSKTEIAKQVGISWTTMSRHWEHVQNLDLVAPTRKIGRATMYKLNESSPVVAALLNFDDAISIRMYIEYGESVGDGESTIPREQPNVNQEARSDE